MKVVPKKGAEMPKKKETLRPVVRVKKKKKKVKKNSSFTPVPYDLLSQGISQSAMKTFMSCRRKWMLNIAGLSSQHTQKNTHFGTIVHELLDLVYQNIHNIEQSEIPGFIAEKLDEFLAGNKEEIAITTEQNEMERAMALAVVEKYFEFFGNDPELFKSMEPEYEFAHEYNGVTLRGKVDGVVELHNGDFWQMEHKTKGRIDEDGLLKTLQYDFQNMMYSFVLNREHPKPIKGIIYNVIRKPGLRIGKKETPPEFLERVKADIAKRPEWYFYRYEIVYSRKEKARFVEQLDGILFEMKEFISGNLPDIQNPAHCLFPFKCQFLDVCALGTTEGLILRERMHPELDNGDGPISDILLRYRLHKPKKIKDC